MATFELAMTESSRLCARLENIFSMLRYNIAHKTQESRHRALESIIELLQVLERPDVRTRLLYLVQGITEYICTQEDARYTAILEAFQGDLRYLRNEPTRLGHFLSQDMLLKQLRAYTTMHGHAAYRMAPLCHLWQNLEEATILSCFYRWVEPMLPLEACVVRIMKFMRSYYQPTAYEVPLGFAKWDLPKSQQIFFVGVTVVDALLPMVSSGQQMISVTFYRALWGHGKVMERYERPVHFEWMVCMLPIRRSN